MRYCCIALTCVTLVLPGGCFMTTMPGKSYSGPLPPMTGEELALRDRLHAHVEHFAGEIGQRNIFTPGTLDASIGYITEIWHAIGYGSVEQQPYEVRGQTVKNLIVELRGASRPDEIIVVGAHYDTPPGVPGANDNGTGIAAVLEI